MKRVDLEAIKAREKAASPGPWVSHLLGGGKGGPNKYSVRDRDGDDGTKDHAVAVCFPRKKGVEEKHNTGAWNAAFIQCARQDIPALIAEVEALREVEKAALSLHEFIDCVNGDDIHEGFDSGCDGEICYMAGDLIRTVTKALAKLPDREKP